MWKKYSLLTCLLMGPALLTASVVTFKNDSELPVKIDNRNAFFGFNMQEVKAGDTITLDTGFYGRAFNFFGTKIPVKFDVYTYELTSPVPDKETKVLAFKPLYHVEENPSNREELVDLSFSQLQDDALETLLRSFSRSFLREKSINSPVIVEAINLGEFVKKLRKEDQSIDEKFAAAMAIGRRELAKLEEEHPEFKKAIDQAIQIRNQTHLSSSQAE